MSDKKGKPQAVPKDAEDILSDEFQVDDLSATLTPSKPYSASSIEFFLRFSDVLAIVIASIVSFIIHADRIEEGISAAYMNVTGISLIISALTISMVGGYDSPVYFRLRSSLKAGLLGWGIAISFLLVAGFAFKVTDIFSRLWVGNWVFSTIVLLLFFRLSIWAIARKLRENKTCCYCWRRKSGPRIK